MTTTGKTLRQSLRITLAIAGKDIVGAIKNKTVQGVMVGVLMMMLTGRALPLLLGLSDFHTVVLFDEGDSELVPALRKRQGIRLIHVDSWEGMQEALTTGGEVALGLVLPPGLDQSLKEGSLPALEGYLAHWARPEEAAELATFFERELSSLTGQAVEIEISERRIYPQPDDDGFTAMAAGVIATVAITVGLFLVPYLLVDEKQTKTLDALLVSPATIGEVVLGKAIAGTVYCLAAAAVAFAFNQALVVNWGLAILATLCGALFAVAVGLLLGSFFDLSPQANGVGAAVLGVLLLPTFLFDLASRWPTWLRTLLSWLPSVAWAKVLRVSFSNVVPLQEVGYNLAAILVPAVVTLAVVAWKIRRSDR